jgi:hypothetical protein
VRLKGRTSGLVPAYRPSGLGYHSHTCRVTRSGCQKPNGAPLWGLDEGHFSWTVRNAKVPSA